MRCSIRAAAVAALLLMCPTAGAQTFQAGMNVADLAELGTISGEAGIAVQRHWSVGAKARINPWTYNEDDLDRQFQSRRQTWWTGARYWPWHVWSGWWTSSGLQYSEYNRGGISNRETEEGDAYGATLSAGYSLMLAEHFNLEFGFGFWGGYRTYTVYSCPVCGKVVEGGETAFFQPNEALLTLMYVF